ncbi:DUF397 domain-containing protein, partial [Marinitenerispora sediminis]
MRWRKSSYSTAQGEDCVECTSATWSTSSYSSGNGACVEYAHLSPAVALRDSKNPHHGH